MLLVGDAGGTKTDLAIVSPESGPRVPLVQAQFHSAAYVDLQSMVLDSLKVGMPVRFWALVCREGDGCGQDR